MGQKLNYDDNAFGLTRSSGRLQGSGLFWELDESAGLSQVLDLGEFW